MVDIAERIVLPEQAWELKKMGLQQLAQYAWFKEDNHWIVCFDDSQALSAPKVVDWKDEEGYYAAPDLTDLGIYLKSLGFYLSGPVYQIEGNEPDPDKIWWADDINSITSFDLDVYKAYGPTEAAAKGALLLSIINEGKIPAQWPYFIVDRLGKITNLVNTSKIYGESTDPKKRK